MTFRQMELFIKVCEEESINKAAGLLFISQQGLSKMIRDLEEELDCILLERHQKGVKPTNCGQYFLGECKNMINKKSFISEHISEIKGFKQEVIYIGMSFGIIAITGYKSILLFEDTHKDIKIEYCDQTDFQLENNFAKGDYNFCLTTSTLDKDLFISEHVKSEAIYLCIPNEHPLYDKPNISMIDLANETFCMYTKQFHIRHNFDKSCEKVGIKVNIALSSNDLNSIKDIAKENGLLFIAPEHTINFKNTNIRYYVFPDKFLKWDIYFIRRKSTILTNNTTLFYNYLKENIN